MRLRLHHRIVLPFAAVAFTALAVLSWVAFRVTSSTLAAHLRQDVLSATGVVSRGGFSTNAGILQAVKAVTGADVVTFGPGGLIATTIDGARQTVIDRVIAGHAGLSIANEPAVVELPGAPSFYAAYQAVAESPGVTVALVHDNTEITAANRLLRQALVGAAAASLLGMLFVSAFVARRVTAPIQQLSAFAETVAAGRDAGIRPPDGALRAGAVPRRAASGDDEVGRLGASFNAMLERVDQAQDALVRSEKLGVAGLFAARVAHDVRNPLSAIKMQTQLLRGTLPAGPAGDEGREVTAAILHDISQVEFVIRGLLDVARPGAPVLVPGDVTPIVQDVLRQIDPQCRHRRVTLTSDLAEALPSLRLDADRLRQALQNVVTNAVEAVREGGAVRVATRHDAGAGAIEILVEDDGVGLDPEAAGRLFDPFVTTKPDGVGLGLVNAKATMEGHGGTIRIAPRLPTGTRAVILLPVDSQVRGGVPESHG